MGRMLPVFLAILFMGGAEQGLAPANVAGSASSRLAFESVSPDRAACNGVRAALCLLPAFLTHACQTASRDLPGYCDRFASTGFPGGRLVGIIERPECARSARFLKIAPRYQRPPPVA